ADERKLMSNFVKAQRDRFQKGELKGETIADTKGKSAVEAAVWTLATRALFNLDEFVTKG
ncbi:MAG: hypothetical protein U0984_07305, partial [Prosthecobacter sp.]|nr:hypothetical protein [Prosthecobacter sp.]